MYGFISRTRSKRTRSVEDLFGLRLHDLVDDHFGWPVDLTFDAHVWDMGDAFFLQAHIPGVDRDSIQVEVTEGCVTIVVLADDAKQKSFYLDVTDTVDAEDILAVYGEGFLEVVIPKPSTWNSLADQGAVH